MLYTPGFFLMKKLIFSTCLNILIFSLSLWILCHTYKGLFYPEIKEKKFPFVFANGLSFLFLFYF